MSAGYLNPGAGLGAPGSTMPNDPIGELTARQQLAKLLGADRGYADASPKSHPMQVLAQVVQGAAAGMQARDALAAQIAANQGGQDLFRAATSGGTMPAVAAAAAQGTAAAAPRASAEPSGPLSTSAQYAYDGLVKRGIPAIVAAGMVGNMSGESAFNTGAIGDKGTSFGLIQARGDRATALKSLAAQQGKDWRDVDVQLDHIVGELNGSENSAYKRALAAKTPGEAAWTLAQHYERPAAWALRESGPKRAAAAERAFQQFGRQAQAAPGSDTLAGGMGDDTLGGSQGADALPAEPPAPSAARADLAALFSGLPMGPAQAFSGTSGTIVDPAAADLPAPDAQEASAQAALRDVPLPPARPSAADLQAPAVPSPARQQLAERFAQPEAPPAPRAAPGSQQSPREGLAAILGGVQDGLDRVFGGAQTQARLDAQGAPSPWTPSDGRGGLINRLLGLDEPAPAPRQVLQARAPQPPAAVARPPGPTAYTGSGLAPQPPAPPQPVPQGAPQAAVAAAPQQAAPTQSPDAARLLAIISDPRFRYMSEPQQKIVLDQYKEASAPKATQVEQDGRVLNRMPDGSLSQVYEKPQRYEPETKDASGNLVQRRPDGKLEILQAAEKDPEVARKLRDALTNWREYKLPDPNDPANDAYWKEFSANALGGRGGVNVNLPAAQTAEEKGRGEGLATRMNDIAKDGEKAAEDSLTYSRFADLLKNVQTGKMTELREKFRQATGLALDPNADNVQALNALIQYMGPRLRVPGSGAQSDRELQNFLSSIPSLAGTPGGNQQILDTLAGLVEHRKQRSAIAAEWQLGDLSAKEAQKRIDALPSPFAKREPERPGPAPDRAAMEAEARRRGLIK